MTVMNSKSVLKLSELLSGFGSCALAEDVNVSSVCIDSRKLNDNSVFIALPGVGHHGLEFLSVAIEAGAVCVVYGREDSSKYAALLEQCKDKVLLIAVENVKQVAGELLSRFYRKPSEKLQLVAVTGTDGKTSVTRFLAQVMSSKYKAAVIGTTGNGLWGRVEKATHTTPDMARIHEMLAEFVDQSAEFVAMEVSSHGIDQNRIAGLAIDTAILTNVTRDHLDYHGTVENYREVKKQLFRLPVVKNIVVNIDDAVGVELAKELVTSKNTWVYGFDQRAKQFEQYVWVKQYEANRHGFSLTLETPQGELDLQLPLIGQFNILNIMAVVSVLLINSFDDAQIAEQISHLQTAPGRMEMIVASHGAVIVVDYAHTPKALELALSSLKQHFDGKTWCVFGCGGDRDKGKRPLMAFAAEKYADEIIVTDDNPRSEDSSEIISQILSGFSKTVEPYVIADRKSAIEFACRNAANNDVVLVAGKGHEDYQQIGDKKLPFSDLQIVRDCLETLS